MKTTDDMVLFWATADIYSNWHPAKFQICGMVFHNSEQYMMVQKALLMGDTATAELMMNEKDPRKLKAMGRAVKKYDESLWVAHRLEIMVDGCYAKFRQNAPLMEQLLATGEKTIVEASPYDKIWGIGLSENDPRVENKSSWCGLNLLGEALMIVRARLAEEVRNQV